MFLVNLFEEAGCSEDYLFLDETLQKKFMDEIEENYPDIDDFEEEDEPDEEDENYERLCEVKEVKDMLVEL
eukprot:2618464-Rhodomonas_salina.1